MSPPNERASSPVIATVLTVAIVILLAILVLIMASGMMVLGAEPDVPVIFEITMVRHVNENGVMNCDSHVVIRNSGNVAYDNQYLSARTYRNGVRLPCDIPTMNGHDFIPVHPFGIQRLGGVGSLDHQWVPEALIAIDYNHGTFRPGDTVMFEVYDTTTGQLISRDTWPHANNPGEKWMKMYLSRQGV